MRIDRKNKTAYNILVVGDSILWGQGLREEQKFASLVARRLQQQSPELDVQLFRFAHSASLTWAPGSSVLLDWLNIWPPPLRKVFEPTDAQVTAMKLPDANSDARDKIGETPQFDPYTWCQLYAARQLADVRLVIFDAGINDIGVPNIVLPYKSHMALTYRIHSFAGYVLHFLKAIHRRFPDAKIIVTGFYPLLSKKSKFDIFLKWVKAFLTVLIPECRPDVDPKVVMRELQMDSQIQATIDRPFESKTVIDPDVMARVSPRPTPKGVAAKTKASLLLGIDNQLVRLSDVFDTEIHKVIRRDIADFNAQSGRNIAALARPLFRAENALFAKDSYLFALNDALEPEDPMRETRNKVCPTVTENPVYRFICDRACLAHPNEKGAKAYADSIEAALAALETKREAREIERPRISTSKEEVISVSEKVIVTNFSALTGKYGKPSIQQIKSALDAYVKADQKRGINTVVIAIDDAKKMKNYGNKTVTDAANEKQNKEAIDAVYSKLQPDYLVLLGSTDVIPHQSIKNLMFNPPNDPDEFALSDLPYACDAPYSQEPGNFNAPTRVVGRLPDITGSDDSQYLVDLLNTCLKWKPKPTSAYSDYLGLTALVWQGSTTLSLNNIFGNDSDLQTSPKAGPKWSTKFISRLAHFINCHGSPIDPFYYGQESTNYPQAHAASFLESTPDIQEGTVVAAECCYGAELYDPEDIGQMGICNTYLKREAYGFFGSSTIAYGPADTNSDADLICQYFLKYVVDGSSTGRAALEARLEFIKESGLLDPVNLKTLCQFNLMGDPSITPVSTAKSEKAPKAMRGIKTMDFERTQRRINLKAMAEALGRSVPVAKRLPTAKGEQASTHTALQQLLKQEKVSSPNVMSFQIAAPASPVFRSTKRALEVKSGQAAKTLPNRVHVVFEEKAMAAPKAVRGAKAVLEKAAEKIPPHASALVAWEHDGKIISYRKVFQH